MHAFLVIAVIHLLAVVSPGPDFALMVQQSVSQPRRVVLATALGLAGGVMVHVTYSLLGIGLVIAQSILLFTTIKLVGAAYLLWIGWKALRSRPTETAIEHREQTLQTVLQGFGRGFLCNALNPKATLFFLALFTQVIDPRTPLSVEMLYGLFMGFQTFYWFAILGTMLTHRSVQSIIGRIHVHAERVMGAVLIALGIKVALSSRH